MGEVRGVQSVRRASTTMATWVACLRIERIGIAVERARLPHLVDEPFVLAGFYDGVNGDGSGTVQVASEVAARLGVSANMSVQGARGLCPDLVVLPYDCAAYEHAARAVWDALAAESGLVEPVSPEVCYAEIGGRTQAEVAERLRALAHEVSPKVGAPVRIGLARTKFVALRAAGHDAARDNSMGSGGDDPITAVPLGEEARFLASVPLAALPPHPRLDRKAKQQLQKLGVRTLGDVWSLPPHRLPRSLQRVGHQLLQWAQGYDSDPVRALWPPRVVCAAVRFEDGLSDRFLAENALLRLAERVSGELSVAREFCREVTLVVGLEDGTSVQVAAKLALPESQVPPLYRAAARLLNGVQVDQPVTSLEVVAGEVGIGSGVQLSLMDRAGELPHERAKRLEAALSHLRGRYGPRAVIPAALLYRARRIHLWTRPLGEVRCEPLEGVATDAHGVPVRYWRRRAGFRRTSGTAGRTPRRGTYGAAVNADADCYEVVAVHDRWRETGTARDGALADAEVWRVETDPFGVTELRRVGTEWRLTAAWD